MSACQFLLCGTGREGKQEENQREVTYLHSITQILLPPNQKKAKRYLYFAY